MKVPGFRPGKAPKPVVDSYVGQDTVYSEATEALVSDSYPKAVDIEGLRPIESPKVEDLEHVKPGEDFVWSAEVQVRPELTLSSYDDISVTVPSGEVTDADIDAQIEQLRGRFASLGPSRTAASRGPTSRSSRSSATWTARSTRATASTSTSTRWAWARCPSSSTSS